MITIAIRLFQIAIFLQCQTRVRNVYEGAVSKSSEEKNCESLAPCILKVLLTLLLMKTHHMLIPL